jgi:hypothetical protein
VSDRVVPVLWLCGARGVGKSVVGWETFVQVRRTGVTAAYVDLAQIGFCRPVPDDHVFRARNLGGVWSGYQAAGARCLIISGDVHDRATVDRYVDAVPGAVSTLCRLRAGRERLTERILLRGRGGGVPLAGDELRGLPTDELHRIAEQVTRGADAVAVGDMYVDTDDLTVQEVAELVLVKSRYLAGPEPLT